MTDQSAWVTERFEEHRTRLRAVAYRMLGSHSEAEDAVQEAWLRISRADTSVVENMAAWLTTVVARVCLNMLRSRNTRREEPGKTPQPLLAGTTAPSPRAHPGGSSGGPCSERRGTSRGADR